MRCASQLEGVADRDAADALRECADADRALGAARGRAEREYYREDLLGFTVRNSEGAVLGELQHFLEAPAGPVMVVQRRRARVHWLPAEPTAL